MKMQMMKGAVGTVIGLIAMAGIAAASNVNIGVEVVTPNVTVRASNVPSPPPVTVVERERVVVLENEDHHDNRRHKKDKKHKKEKKEKKHKHNDE